MTPHVLPDMLATGLRVGFCGTAVGTQSAVRGAYYAGPGNSFWRTLHAIGLTPTVLAPDEFQRLSEYGIGLTDIAKCRAGNDDVLVASDFGSQALVEKLQTFSPRAVAFNGKRAAAAFYDCRTAAVHYGVQPEPIGTTRVFVLPSTSGSARSYWNIGFWRAAADFARG